MALYKEISDNVFVVWNGEPIDDISHPKSIEMKWSEAELAVIGLYRPVAASPAPPHKIITNRQVQRVSGVVKWVETYEDEPNPDSYVVTSEMVNAERDRRIKAGFLFDGHPFDFDDASKARIIGAATLAGFAMAAQNPDAVVGNYMWTGDTSPFAWILADNTTMLIDAPTMFEIGQKAAQWESTNIFLGRAIKNIDPIPLDYTDDQYWTV